MSVVLFYCIDSSVLRSMTEDEALTDMTFTEEESDLKVQKKKLRSIIFEHLTFKTVASAERASRGLYSPFKHK